VVGGGCPTPYAALVLAAVDLIPRRQVMSYGDMAEYSTLQYAGPPWPTPDVKRCAAGM
jgi:hypothetical protein